MLTHAESINLRPQLPVINPTLVGQRVIDGLTDRYHRLNSWANPGDDSNQWLLPPSSDTQQAMDWMTGQLSTAEWVRGQANRASNLRELAVYVGAGLTFISRGTFERQTDEATGMEAVVVGHNLPKGVRLDLKPGHTQIVIDGEMGRMQAVQIFGKGVIDFSQEASGWLADTARHFARRDDKGRYLDGYPGIPGDSKIVSVTTTGNWLSRREEVTVERQSGLERVTSSSWLGQRERRPVTRQETYVKFKGKYVQAKDLKSGDDN